MIFFSPQTFHFTLSHKIICSVQVPVHPVRSLAVPEADGGEEEEAPGEDEEAGRGGNGGGKGKCIFGI